METGLFLDDPQLVGPSYNDDDDNGGGSCLSSFCISNTAQYLR